MSILLGIIIIAAALLCEAFFAGSETGIISANRIKLTNLADKGDRRAAIVKGFLDNPEHFLGTTLVGVNLSVIISSSIATAVVAAHFKGTNYAAAITTAIMLPLILIFGEIIPKAFFRQHADAISLWISYPLKAASIILFPLVWLATEVSSLISRIFTKGKLKKNPYVTREEIKLLLRDAAKQELITKDEIKMASEIFDFGRTDVSSVMVPLSNVVSASDKSTKNELAQLIAQSGYSRIPIYVDNPANIIGTIQVSDLITEKGAPEDIGTIIRKPYTVREDNPIDELLNDLKGNQKNIAIVTDKNNKAIGIVTLEDVAEEIVGEIEDEYDTGA